MTLNKGKLTVFLTSFVLVFFVFNLGVALAASDVMTNLDKTVGQGFVGNPTATETERKDAGVVTSIPGAIGKFVGAGLSLLGVIFLVLMIYGGFSWMTARGNEQAVTTAQGVIQSAIIGLIVVLLAYALTAFLGTALSG